MSFMPWTVQKELLERQFRPHRGRYSPVPGGRWFIRRWEDNLTKKDGRVWHAWTRGRAKKLNRRFHTQEEAIYWAERVTAVYKMRDYHGLVMLYHEKYPNITSHSGVQGCRVQF